MNEQHTSRHALLSDPSIDAVCRRRSAHLVRGCVLQLVLVVALAAPLSFMPAAASTTSPDLDAYLRGQLDRSALPGFSVAVIRDHEIVHLAGYGTAGGGREMTPHTPSPVASLSKSFTAVAALQQVEGGALKLDTPVQHYLPDFRLGDDDAAAAITIRHLLNHTSGLADQGFPGLWRLDARSAAERVAGLSEARPLAAPGTAFHYFGPNYEILARLVEVASGQRFDDYLQHHIFGPLGMTDTLSITRSEDARLAVPDLAQGHIALFGVPVERDEDPGYVGGSGGVVTTAADAAKWLMFHTNAGAAEGRVLHRDYLDLAHAHPEGVSSTYGMGWLHGTSGGHPTIEHNGVFATAYAEQVLLPETNHGIVLIANGNHALSDGPRIVDGIVALITDGSAPAPLVTYRRLATTILTLMLVGLWLRTGELRRRTRWAPRHLQSRSARRWFGILRLLAPAVLLVLLPTLTATAGGRVFPMRLLALAAPEVVIWLVVASCTGVALATARLAALASARRRDPSATHTVPATSRCGSG